MRDTPESRQSALNKTDGAIVFARVPNSDRMSERMKLFGITEGRSYELQGEPIPHFGIPGAKGKYALAQIVGTRLPPTTTTDPSKGSGLISVEFPIISDSGHRADVPYTYFEE